MADFGEILKNLRQSRGITQAQLAERLGISRTAVSYREQSVKPPPSGILIDLSRIFHVSVDYLLGLEEKRRTIEVSDLPERDVDFLDKTADFLRDKNNENSENDDQKNTV